MKRRIIVGLGILLATSGGALAGDLVSGASITHVSNTASNTAAFSVQISGGTGPCGTAGQWITFPLLAAPDADTHKRAYASVLLAFTMGLHVRIHNYSGSACDGASYVEIYN